MIDLEENRGELQKLKIRFENLEKTIGTAEKLEKALKELEEKTLVQGFWDDTKSANMVLRDMKEIKGKYNSITNIKNDLYNLLETNDFLSEENDDEMAQDLVKSTNRLANNIEKLETKMYLSGKYDRNNAIITLHPGARRYRITRLGRNALPHVF